jgi:hypothetical protein
MALPITVFYFLVIVAVALFVIGLTRYSVGAGFSFTALSGIFFILTGLLLWTGGLQTNTLNTWDTTSDVITAEYQELTFAVNPEIMLLSYFFTFGGFFPIVLALRNVFLFKQSLKAEQELDFN